MVIAAAVAGIWTWTTVCERDAHYMPETEYVNIEEIVAKREWSRSDCRVLSQQTGLSEVVLRALASAGRKWELLSLQEAYFREVRIACEPNTVISREEFLVDEEGNMMRGMPIPYVEEGDILITNCSHALGWRNGHAGIVVDAGLGLVLEAQVLGSPSVVTSLRRWEYYPSFVVLRLKNVDKEDRAEIARYALKNLVGIPYRLEAGILERLLGSDSVTRGTHCAHLIWQAYGHFGYDLDSDGGLIVTPKDIAESDKLSIIQKYGIKM